MHFILSGQPYVSAWNYDDYNTHYNSNQHRFYTNNYHYDSSTPSVCHCKNVKYCPVILDIILAADKPISTDLVQRLRRIRCGYDRDTVMVCCPPIDARYRRDDFRRRQAENNEKPWIWDTEPNTHNSHETSIQNRFHHDSKSLYNSQNNWELYNSQNNWEFYNFHAPIIHPNDYNFESTDKRKFHQQPKKHYFFEFEDPKTFKNCPKSISGEFDLPHHFRYVKPINNTHPLHIPNDDIGSTTMVATTTRVDTTVPEVVETTTSTEPSPPDVDKTKLINTELCGLSVNTRIVGGEDADPGQFPWMARLAYRNRCK